MKFIKWLYNHLIVVLCLTILCVVIGFIILALVLKSERNSIPVFDVSFVDIKKESVVKGSAIEPVATANILDGGQKIDMNFTLNSVHDEFTYLVTIENKGTLPAEIVDILQSPDYSIQTFQNMIAPISISLSDIKGKVIPVGAQLTLKIIVYYPPSNFEVQRKDFSYSIGIIAKSH